LEGERAFTNRKTKNRNEGEWIARNAKSRAIATVNGKGFLQKPSTKRIMSKGWCKMGGKS